MGRGREQQGSRIAIQLPGGAGQGASVRLPKESQGLSGNCSPQAWRLSSPIIKAGKAALTDVTNTELSVTAVGPTAQQGCTSCEG